ncbi:MAG: sensor histidine kinase [Actinomycetota bacterium]
MNATRAYAWTVVLTAASLTAVMWATLHDPQIPVGAFLFWAALLAAAELLPVSLGFETSVTMGFPILLATAILYDPPVAMTIAALGYFDLREVKWQIPPHRALFNRAQVMMAVGTGASIIYFIGSANFVVIGIAASAHLFINLALVAGAVHFEHHIPFKKALAMIPPRPLSGFATTSLLLTALGGATALAYREVEGGGEWIVIAILVPLLFARMAILGAKTQQELSERIQKQQEALLDATETVFQEREGERARIAEHIHDSSLQMLAAASYGVANAQAFLRAGDAERARKTLRSAEEAVQAAMSALRDALVDLRRSSVEEGGLMTTLTKFAEQISTLWGADVTVVGEIENEPPIPVALAAFQIVQEGLVNSLKHSQTDNVRVRISEQDGKVHLVVEDEGAGFDPNKQVGSDHVGMTLMRQRAEGVGGEIRLDSSPGEGTRLEAILPAGVSAA